MPDEGVHTDIIGGQPATQNYPGAVAVQMTVDGVVDSCAGTVVEGGHGYWVRTAASCATNRDLSPRAERVGYGSPDTGKMRTVDIAQIYAHAAWSWGANPGPIVADIAMLRLKQPIPVRPMAIGEQAGGEGTPTRVIGWGSTDPADTVNQPTMMQQLDLEQVPASECAAGGIRQDELCLSGTRGRNVCWGDAGDAAMERVAGGVFRLVGSVSRGIRATPTEPCTGRIMASNVTYYRTWIAYVMCHRAVPPVQTPAIKPPTAPVILPGPQVVRWAAEG